MHLQKNFEMLVRISVVFQGMQKISNANLNLAKMYKNSAQYFLKSNNCFMFRSPEIWSRTTFAKVICWPLIEKTINLLYRPILPKEPMNAIIFILRLPAKREFAWKRIIS